jgi:hypothetical protein
MPQSLLCQWLSHKVRGHHHREAGSNSGFLGKAVGYVTLQKVVEALGLTMAEIALLKQH